MDLIKKSFLYVVGFIAITAEEAEKRVKEQRQRIEKIVNREPKPAHTNN